MEALTAASVAALTIYDMTKMIDDDVIIREVRLISKRGGKSDIHEEFESNPSSRSRSFRFCCFWRKDGHLWQEYR